MDQVRSRHEPNPKPLTALSGRGEPLKSGFAPTVGESNLSSVSALEWPIGVMFGYRNGVRYLFCWSIKDRLEVHFR